MTDRARTLTTVALAIGLVMGTSAEADVIHLTNGRTLDVRVWHDTGDAVEFVKYGGVVRIPKTEIARIEGAGGEGRAPHAAWPTRGPGASPPRPDEYVLHVGGAAAHLERVRLNGDPVIGGAVVSVERPIPVWRHLRNGINTLEVEYTSAKQEGLHLVIERRRGAVAESLATFASGPDETRGRRVRRIVRFTVRLPASAEPRVTEADRQEIRALIRAHYGALTRRDLAGVLALYDRAGAGMERLSRKLGRLFASPAFRMTALRLIGIRFTRAGPDVVVDRPDRLPIFGTTRIDVEEEVALIVEGEELRRTVVSSVAMAPWRLRLTKVSDRWRFIPER